jgi:hypothetical protein
MKREYVLTICGSEARKGFTNNSELMNIVPWVAVDTRNYNSSDLC